MKKGRSEFSFIQHCFCLYAFWLRKTAHKDPGWYYWFNWNMIQELSLHFGSRYLLESGTEISNVKDVVIGQYEDDVWDFWTMSLHWIYFNILQAYLPMTTPTNHNNKTKVKCYNLFPSFQHDQYITNTFISQSYGSFTKQLYLYSASVLPCFCFSVTQRIFQISIASVLYPSSHKVKCIGMHSNLGYLAILISIYH